MKKPLLLAATLLLAAAVQAQKTYTLTAPNGALQTTVSVGEILTYDIVRDGRTLMNPSPVALTLDNGSVWGPKARVTKASRTSVDRRIASPLYRADSIREHYNALTLRMKGDWDLEFRAYDDGIAYRFVSRAKKPFAIVNEQVEFRFPEDYQTTLPYVRSGKDGDWESQYFNSFENIYTVAPLSQLNTGRLAFLPLVVDAGAGVKICITESDLQAYPGLFLRNTDGGTTLTGQFAPCPIKTQPG